MALTDQQRNWIWIGIAVIAILLVVAATGYIIGAWDSTPP